jgi:3-phenylpropionate/cinnamic acid dioxygenase small subunit
MDPSEMSDRLELQELAFAYAAALDERNSEAFAELFTPDAHLGVYEPDSETPLLGYDGHDEIRTAVALLDRYDETLHVMTNHRVTLDGDDATGTVYCLAHHITVREGTRHNLVMTIRYHDRYRRSTGAWRLTHRKIVRFWNELRPVLVERAAF